MTVFWLLLLSFAPATEAYLRLKFKHWCPQYEAHWLGSSYSICKQRLEDYYQDNRTECDTPCACAPDCILQNVTGTIQSNFSSAQVLLGLLPTVLIFAGPTIAEVSVLSAYRPLLTVLLTLGSPATNVTKLFNRVDVREPFDRQRSSTFTRWLSWVQQQHYIVRILLRSLSYVGALAALANNVRNSIHLDLRTISGWRCGALFLPLAWSVASVLVHTPSMVAIRIRLQNRHMPSISATFQSTAYQEVLAGKDTLLSDTLFGVASFFAIIHLIFGILEFSSLVFISALEALQVFVQYACSALLCQFILLLELADMRRASSGS